VITVECTYLNPETMMPTNSVLTKTFTRADEFKSFYSLAKADPCVILNVILRYDPVAKPGFKDYNDARLLRLSKENPV
jgi:hypothetical protein